MKTLRLACAAFVGWLFVLFNVERIHEPMNLASFVYVIAAVTGIAIVGIKPVGTAKLQWLLGLPLAAFLVLKGVMGYEVLGPAFPITVVESCALAVTVALAHQIAVRLDRLEKASAGMISDDPNRQPVSLWAAQGELYREVRRARRHNRPLSVLAVTSTGEGVNPEEERLLRELQRELLDKYAKARIADFLAKEAEDHGIVTHYNRHFVVLLPETDRDASEQIVRRLKSSVEAALGLKLRIGVSTFPDEEVTLVGLFQRAETAMHDVTNTEHQTGGEGDKHQARTAPTEAPLADEAEFVEASSSETGVDIQANRETVAAPPSRVSRVAK